MRSKGLNLGFSLIELMVGMTVGLIMLAAVVALTTSILRTNAETVVVAKLTQEGRAIGDLASRELRRARYSGNYLQFVGSNGTIPNAFGGIEINNGAAWTSLPTGSTGSCIRFAYDADDDGSLDANEVKVISLYNDAVYLGQYATYAGATCVTNASQANSALRISSPDVVVTSLQFRGNTANAPLPADVNRLDLVFQLALAGNASITRRFDQSVQLRNPFL